MTDSGVAFPSTLVIFWRITNGPSVGEKKRGRDVRGDLSAYENFINIENAELNLYVELSCPLSLRLFISRLVQVNLIYNTCQDCCGMGDRTAESQEILTDGLSGLEKFGL